METKLLTANASELKDDQLGVAIVQSLRESEKSRDLCIAAAGMAISHAIICGELLIIARDRHRGEFLAWLESYCRDEEGNPIFSQATAYNYIRAVKYKAALGVDCPEFSTLKELFIAAGILPPPTTADTSHRPAAPLFKLQFALNAPPPEEWESMDRKEFLERAKPVVDLYERVKAAEKAA